MRDTTERQYEYIWMPRLEQLGLIKFVKSPDPTKDGPPLVTKAHIEQARKDMAVLRIKGLKAK